MYILFSKYCVRNIRVNSSVYGGMRGPPARSFLVVMLWRSALILLFGLFIFAFSHPTLARLGGLSLLSHFRNLRRMSHTDSKFLKTVFTISRLISEAITDDNN